MAFTIPGLALLITAVAFADVAYRKATGRSCLPWMRGDDEPRSAAGIGFEQFDALFNSGKRAEFEQRQSVLMHRENPGDGDKDFAVDLSTGKAVLRKD
ncbi:hypothetical protein JK358_36830 [Nocardia sp. 2]|uniref:Uncharacterized protein n=1 Tax=Nocardia acididurans TaxID=2802282 RepID=A0ABS1MH31_9NOCA|nr:DUF6191 domain-containing protein [Nocardia acididurans]MBL1079977.1 hypothetical protein [Nocardia acididurans]